MKLSFLSLFVLGFVSCTPTSEAVPVPTPVPTAISPEALIQYEVQQAVRVLLGSRLSSFEVQNALEVIRRQETPERTTPPAALPDPFETQVSTPAVVETYPKAGIEVTLKEGQVVEVRQLFEGFVPGIWE